MRRRPSGLPRVPLQLSAPSVGDLLAYLPEKGRLQLLDPFLGVENACLILFHLGRMKTFPAQRVSGGARNRPGPLIGSGLLTSM